MKTGREGGTGQMRVTQGGCDGIVALLGTAFSPAALSWLSHAAAVLLMLDADSAGRQAAEKIERTLAPLTAVRRCRLPLDCEPEDLCDPELRRIIRKTLPAYSLWIVQPRRPVPTFPILEG